MCVFLWVWDALEVVFTMILDFSGERPTNRQRPPAKTNTQSHKGKRLVQNLR